MLPATNERTLSRCLLSAAHTIRQQLAAVLDADAVPHLSETAAVIARVAQQIDQRGESTVEARGEYAAILAAEAQLDMLVDASGTGLRSAGGRSVHRDRVFHAFDGPA